MIELNGKVAVVTGGGRGLGLAVSQALARAGAAVVVNDVDEAAIEQAVASINSQGGRAAGLAAPIGSTHAAEQCVDHAVSQFGRLDIMCANAGILRDKVLWNMTDDDFDQVIDTHLRGTFTCARAAVRHFRQQGEGGRLILLSSLAGQRGNFGQTNYAAAKAGVIALVKSVAQEIGTSGVTLNVVSPGATNTPLRIARENSLLAQMGEEKYARRQKSVLKMYPTGRIGEPDDIGAAILFLASDRASWITGQVLSVNGGFAMP